MSNEKAGESPARRKPKVSWVKSVFPGLVGPSGMNARIGLWETGSYSRTFFHFDGMTHEVKRGRATVVPVQAASR